MEDQHSMTANFSRSRNNTIDETASNGTKKSSVKHLYSVKEREKDIQKERNDFQENLKSLEQQVEGQKDVDNDLLNQLHALQQEFDSHASKWNETENLVIALRNQKGELEAQVKNLSTSLLDAENEIRTSHQRIEDLERQLTSNGQMYSVAVPAVAPQPTSTHVALIPDFSNHFHEISRALGSISSQLESQFTMVRRLVEDNNGSISQLQSIQNETQNTLSQIQEAQHGLQTAVANLSITVATASVPSNNTQAKNPLEGAVDNNEMRTEPQVSETLQQESQTAPVSAPVVSQVTATDDSQLIEIMRTELESFKRELFVVLQQQQQATSQVTSFASFEVPQAAPTKEPVEEPTPAPIVKKEPIKSTTLPAKTSTTKPAVKSTTATKTTTTTSKPASKTSAAASKTSTITKKV